MKAGTAQNIWQQAYNSTESNDLNKLSAVLNHKKKTKQLLKVVDGTTDLTTVQTILYKERQKIFKKAAKNYEIDLAHSTLENIAHDHKDKAHP